MLLFSQTWVWNSDETDGPMEHLLLPVSCEGFLKPGGNAGPIMGLDRGGKKNKKSWFSVGGGRREGSNITDMDSN